jgi:exodeoxyribonuclease V beta subunit
MPDAMPDQMQRRRLHWNLNALPEAGWKHAETTWRRDQRAEAMRLLYVGLTRAQHALWLACGDFYASNKAALAPLLANREAWQAAGIVFDTNPTPSTLPRLLPEASTAVAVARGITRTLHNDWWVHSFSQLSNADAGTERSSAATVPASGGNDEPAADAAVMPEAEAEIEANTFDPRFSGNRFGVALHAALEHADFSAWRGWRDGAPAPAEEASGIAKALATEGYTSELIRDGVALSTRLMGHTLTVTLPEGLRLCELPDAQRRAEIEFQFSLQPVQVDALLALLHAHGIVRARDRFGSRRRLEGLMTGLIDLTYQHAGKWYVLDYKSNRLPGYGPVQLEQAMAHSEYDLQALIYTLALHRWLRFRLGDGYDYARDFGGIRYVFCRGLDASFDASLDAKQDANRNDAPTSVPGIHAQCFSSALVHALDALFGPPTEGASP